jgi:hypothetical protein
MKTLVRYRFVALAVVAAGLVVATVLVMMSGDERGLAGRLGPTPGPNSDGHVAAKKSYLERVAREDPTGEAAALVSLNALVSASEVESMLTDAEGKAVFVQFPGNQGETLEVKTTIEEAVSLRATELANTLRSEIDATTDELEKQERRDALTQLSPQCKCIFAFALDGATLGDLAKLQTDARVRLVEVPDPVVESLEGYELTPIFAGGTPSPSPSP